MKTTTRKSAVAQHHDNDVNDRPGTQSTFFDDAPTPTDAAFPSNVTNAATHSRPTTTIPSTTGPVGEAGLPPARPSTTYSVESNRPSTSYGPSGRTNTAGSIYPSDVPRAPPKTASRTHVPNIISSAFLRPASSAKRSQRQDALPRLDPPAPILPIARKSVDSGRSRSHRHRNSNASIVTVEGHQSRPLVDADAPPLPISRGTDMSIFSTTHRIESEGSGTSRQPLQSPEPLQSPPLATATTLKNQSSPRAPLAIRTSWNRASRPQEQNNSRDGRLKLSSTPPSPAYPPEKTQLGAERPNIGRNYEYYNGNATFFLKGRLINSRQRPLNLLTAFVAILPAILFFIFSAPWLWHNVSPAIPIVFAYLFFICISSFLHASFTEPGIIPRNLHERPAPGPDADPLTVGPPTTEWVTVRSFVAASADGKTTAMEVPVKFCQSCNVWRPPRAHHCRVCDSCVETQDHHCVWLNNCVGRRNYRYFLTFVASGTILGLFLLAATLAQLLVWRARNNTTFGHAINEWRVPFAMFIYSILTTPYPGSLWLYHLFLMGRGETTREYLNSHKFQKKDRHRPFSQASVWKNWVSVVIRARPPTYMQFKSRYAQGDRRIGETAKVTKSKPDKEQKKEPGLEMNQMKQVNGSSLGSSRGFQGPVGLGRGPLNNLNSTPRAPSPLV